VLQRYCGWYANRTRGSRRQVGGDAQPAVVVADRVPPERAAVRRRWAELLRRIFEVGPLRCPRCGTPMRIVAFLPAPAVIRILAHLRHSARPARASRARPLPPSHRLSASRFSPGVGGVRATARPGIAPAVRRTLRAAIEVRILRVAG